MGMDTSMNSFPFIGAGIEGITNLGKMFLGFHQDRLANRIQVPDATYTSSPYAAKMVGMANNFLNAPMPGTQAAQQGIEGAASDATAGAERNATSGAQALALLGGIQGNRDNATTNLATEQGNYKLNALNNYNNANEAEINEGDKVYQSDLQKQQLAIQQKNALRGAATQNIGGAANDLANTSFMLYNMKNNPYMGRGYYPGFE